MVDNNDITNELNTATRREIVDRASDKAFAKLTMLNIELSEYKQELASGSYGCITRSEVVILLEGTKKEIRTWNYKSGMVRKIIMTKLLNQSSCYQLNLTRERKIDYMFFEDDNKLSVRTYKTVKRVPIVQELGRLVYLTEYLIKNRGMKKKGKEFITVNGVKYKRYE